MCWHPTINADDHDRLRQHLWESGRFVQIQSTIWKERPDDDWIGSWQVEIWLDDQKTVRTYELCTDDPNGFRCLCIAALRAYEQEATQENKQ